MKVSFYIARRYLFAKKSHTAINAISAISAVVLAFVTLAMVVVLSAFNGIESLIAKLYSTIDAPLVITPAKGKTMEWTSAQAISLAKQKGFKASAQIIQDEVLLRYNGQQTVASLKGVSANYTANSGLNEAIIDGSSALHTDGLSRAILGAGLHNQMAMPPIDRVFKPIEIYALPKGKSISRDKDQAFQEYYINLGGVFSINADYDTKYIFVPLAFAKKCFNYQNEISAVEVSLKQGFSQAEFKRNLQERLGAAYKVTSREEKNAVLFKTSRTEKWVTFLILIFILIIASFNILASLTMLVIDKRNDIQTLLALGMNQANLVNVFFYQSLLINAIGTVSGLLLGLLFCVLQQYFGLIPLEGSVVAYYPVEINLLDLLAIFGVMALLSSVSYFAVRFLIKRHHKAV